MLLSALVMPSEQVNSRCFFTNQCGVKVPLVWEVSVIALTLYYIEKAADASTGSSWYVGVLAGISCFAYPIFGWLGDSIVGRYRAVKFSLFIIWVSTILFAGSEILASYIPERKQEKSVICIILATVEVIAAACFIVNNFHLGIDQLEDAPSWKISSYISKFVSCIYLGMVVKSVAFNCINSTVSAGLAAVVSSLAVSLSFLCTKEMTVVPTSPNSLALIFNVLKYTVKNKYPRLQSAYSYWRHKKPRINLAKSVYGGPYTSEEVEDVKMFLKLLIIIPVACFLPEVLLSLEIFGKQILIFHYSDNGYAVMLSNQSIHSFQHCLLRKVIYNISGFYITFGIILYETLVYPLFRKYIASVAIRKKLVAGMVFCIVTWLSYLVLEVTGHVFYPNKSKNITCLFDSNKNTFLNGESMSLSYYWLCVPKILKATSQYLLLSSGLEMLCAQSPYSMKSLLVGWAWSMFTVALLGNMTLQRIFAFMGNRWHPFSCGMVYFTFASISAGVAAAFVLLVFAWYSKRRRRDNIMEEEIVSVGFDGN